MTCIGEKRFIDDKNRYKLSDQHFLKNQEEIARIYSDIPEALENNYNFHLRFHFKPKKSKPILPSIANNENKSPEEELKIQAEDGLKQRLKDFIQKKINYKL